MEENIFLYQRLAIYLVCEDCVVHRKKRTKTKTTLFRLNSPRYFSVFLRNKKILPFNHIMPSVENVFFLLFFVKNNRLSIAIDDPRDEEKKQKMRAEKGRRRDREREIQFHPRRPPFENAFDVVVVVVARPPSLGPKGECERRANVNPSVPFEIIHHFT
jgi:hypothetical protein